MRIVRPIVATVEQVPQRVRDLQRLREVAQVLVRHGLGLLVTGIEIPGFPRIATSRFDSTPDRAATALQELGPTFVKLGQVLSTRPDVLPVEYVQAFERLQDDVGPLPFAEVEAVLEHELGEGWRDHFARFEETPLATASIAQVHGATRADGREVVLKVQRPGLLRMIRADLNILHFLAARLRYEFPEADSVDVDGVLAEFERSILAELDFLQEARNQERVRRNFAEHPKVVVPAVHHDLTTRGVLTMERIHGVKIREARAKGHDMVAVGRTYLGAAYDMLFVHGFFHGDLHPGNVLVTPGDGIALLDFGMMGRLTEQMRNDVIFIIFALQRGDYRTIARLFYEIAIKTQRVDYRAVERDTIRVMEKHWSGHAIRDMQLGPYVVDLARKAAEHGARVPPDYTMFFKALVTSEGLAKSLIEEVDPIAAAEPYFEELIRERLSLERLQGDVLYNALTISSVLRRLPISLSQFLDDLDAQRVRLDVRQVADPELQRREDRRATLLALAIVFAATVLAGTLALPMPSQWWLGVPVLTLLLFVLSAGVGFWGVALLTGRRRLAGD